jgi:hypothetical protein
MQGFMMWSRAVALCIVAQSPSEPWREIPFESALRIAQETHHALLVYVWEEDEAECEQYDRTTWSDDGVRRWLAEHAVAIRVPARSRASLPEWCRFGLVPTVILLAPEGESRGSPNISLLARVSRIEGYRTAEALLPALEQALRATDPVEQARIRLEADGGDLAARVTYAQALREAGRLPDALAQFAICLDASPGGGESGDGESGGDDSAGGLAGNRALAVRLMVIDELGALARAFPPAREELIRRRDGWKARVLSPDAGSGAPALLAAADGALGDIDDLLKVHRTLHSSAPRGLTTRLLRDAAVDALITTKRYEQVFELIDVVRQFRLAQEQHEQDVRRPVPGATDLERFRAFLRRQFIERNIRFYEVLVGAGRSEDAERVAVTMLQIDDRPATCAALAEAGLRTGKPVEANLAQARRAVAGSTPPDPRHVELLAQLLRHFGHDEEAARLPEPAASPPADEDKP